MERKIICAFVSLAAALFVSCGDWPKYELGMTVNKTFSVNGGRFSGNVEVTELVSYDKKTGRRTYANAKEPEKNYAEQFGENCYWKEMNSEIVRSDKWEKVGTELKRTETGIVAGYRFVWVTVCDAETKKKKTASTEILDEHFNAKEKTIEFFDSDGKNVVRREKDYGFMKIVTDYEYDGKGRCIRSKEEEFWDGKAPVRALEVAYEYNGIGNLVFARASTGGEARFYDVTDPTSLYAADENDGMLESYVMANWYDKIRHKSEEYCDGIYDENGNLIFAKYDGAERFFEYDGNGKCVHWREVSESGKVSECRTDYFDDGEIRREERTDGDFLVREYNSQKGRHFLIFEKTAGTEVFYEYLCDKNGFVLQMAGFTRL